MESYSDHIDKAGDVREGESPDPEKLRAYLVKHLPGETGELKIFQFPGGYSNLTFLVIYGEKEYVLRKPPRGANIKSAHDMGREFRVLSALKPVYKPIPSPIIYCEDESVIGTPFYLMERVRGIILRNKPPKGIDLTPETMRAISISAVRQPGQLFIV